MFGRAPDPPAPRGQVAGSRRNRGRGRERRKEKEEVYRGERDVERRRDGGTAKGRKTKGTQRNTNTQKSTMEVMKGESKLNKSN